MGLAIAGGCCDGELGDDDTHEGDDSDHCNDVREIKVRMYKRTDNYFLTEEQLLMVCCTAMWEDGPLSLVAGDSWSRA
jgi:hypothetical protein